MAPFWFGLHCAECNVMKTSSIGYSRAKGQRREPSYPIRGLIVAGITSVLIAAAGSSCLAGTDDDYLTNPYSRDDKQVIAHGGELFGRNCQQCHNSHGKGGKAPQLIRGAWGPGGANSDAFMFNTINAGRTGTQMGAWGLSLSPEDIWAIITYLRAESVKAKLEDDQDDQ